MPTEFTNPSGSYKIRKIKGGYVLSALGAGGVTILWIDDTGGMMDTSGAAVDQGDRELARQCLSRVDGGKQLVGRLRPVPFNAGIATRVRRLA